MRVPDKITKKKKKPKFALRFLIDLSGSGLSVEMMITKAMASHSAPCRTIDQILSARKSRFKISCIKDNHEYINT